MTSLYIGCGLTHAPEHFRLQVQQLKQELSGDFQILDFIGLEKGTAQDVFNHDLKCVKTCDMFVAICDWPAIGLGIEIGIALENDVPTLLLAHEYSTVSRLILGIDHPDFKMSRYSDFAQIQDIIRQNV